MSPNRPPSGLLGSPPAVLPGDTELRSRVLGLRLSGANYDAIARAVPEIESAEQAARLAELGLKWVESLSGWESENRVSIEHARLDVLERNTTAILQNSVSAGDHQMGLAAIDRLLRISERRLALDMQDGHSGRAAPDDPLEQARVAVQNKLRLVTGTPST